MINKFFTILVLGSVLLIGCATSTSYSDKPLPSKSSTAPIEVVNIDQLRRNYEIVGKCSTLGEDIKGLKDQARKLGADAISIPKSSPDSYWVSCQAIKWK